MAKRNSHHIRFREGKKPTNDNYDNNDDDGDEAVAIYRLVDDDDVAHKSNDTTATHTHKHICMQAGSALMSVCLYI